MILAFSFVVGALVLQRILWMDRNPGFSVVKVEETKCESLDVTNSREILSNSEVLPTTLVQGTRRPFPLGRPLQARFFYRIRLAPDVPLGLVYRIEVKTRLNCRSQNAIEHTDEWVDHLASGRESWRLLNRTVTHDVTPQHRGQYIIEYEIRVIDPLGRTIRLLRAINYFDAR